MHPNEIGSQYTRQYLQMLSQECTGCWGVEETWELGVVISDWVIFSIIAATLVIASMVALLFIPAGIIRFAPK